MKMKMKKFIVYFYDPRYSNSSGYIEVKAETAALANRIAVKKLGDHFVVSLPIEEK